MAQPRKSAWILVLVIAAVSASSDHEQVDFHHEPKYEFLVSVTEDKEASNRSHAEKRSGNSTEGEYSVSSGGASSHVSYHVEAKPRVVRVRVLPPRALHVPRNEVHEDVAPEMRLLEQEMKEEMNRYFWPRRANEISQDQKPVLVVRPSPGVFRAHPVEIRAPQRSVENRAQPSPVRPEPSPLYRSQLEEYKPQTFPGYTSSPPPYRSQPGFRPEPSPLYFSQLEEYKPQTYSDSPPRPMYPPPQYRTLPSELRSEYRPPRTMEYRPPYTFPYSSDSPSAMVVPSRMRAVQRSLEGPRRFVRLVPTQREVLPHHFMLNEPRFPDVVPMTHYNLGLFDHMRS